MTCSRCIFCYQNYTSTNLTTNQQDQNLFEIIWEIFKISTKNEEVQKMILNASTTSTCPPCTGELLRIDEILKEIKGLQAKCQKAKLKFENKFIESKSSSDTDGGDFYDPLVDRVRGKLFENYFLGLGQSTSDQEPIDVKLKSVADLLYDNDADGDDGDNDDGYQERDFFMDSFQPEDFLETHMNVIDSNTTTATDEKLNQKTVILLEPMPVETFIKDEDDAYRISDPEIQDFIKSNLKYIVHKKPDKKFGPKSKSKPLKEKLKRERRARKVTTATTKKIKIKKRGRGRPPRGSYKQKERAKSPVSKPTTTRKNRKLELPSQLVNLRASLKDQNKINKVPLKCTLCSKQFTGKTPFNSLKTHFLYAHPEISGYTKPHCLICKKQFLNIYNLKEHQRKHKEGQQNITCTFEECRRVYKSKHTYRLHLRQVHGQGPPLQSKCDVCEKVFYSKYALNQHKTSHSESNQFLCSFCPKSFKNHFYFMNHVKSVHGSEGDLKCPYCGRSGFHKPGYLEVHIKEVHEKVVNYTCDTCGKGFFSLHNLKHHIKYHPGKSNYACSQCPKTFSTNGYLMDHLRTHTKEKPFSCEICGVSFAQSANLTTHKQIHSNHKKFACSDCNKPFMLKRYLRAHWAACHLNEGKGAKMQFYIIPDPALQAPPKDVPSAELPPGPGNGLLPPPTTF